MMGNLIDKVLPRYYEMCSMLGIDSIYREVNMTATTNKAAEVLSTATKRPADTLHKFLKLSVYNDLSTGKTRITRNRDWSPHFKKVIFVDEAFMTDTVLRKHLLESTEKCKIVYVGDHCQLAPVGELVSPIYVDILSGKMPFYALTQPMRNAGQPALIDVCQQLRKTVETDIFEPIRVVPGVIDYMDQYEMVKEVHKLFMNPSTKDRILCYTNDKVNSINRFIRNSRGMPLELTVGEFAVNNSAVITDHFTLRVEEEFEVLEIGVPKKHLVPMTDVEVNVRPITLKGKHEVFPDVLVPLDWNEIRYWIKLFQSKADEDKQFWKSYFYLKETFPDLRPRDACTVYKAQGSTYQTTLVDLTDISKCYDPAIVARMLYVAFSRAKGRIVMFGTLDKKYGGIIT